MGKFLRVKFYFGGKNLLNFLILKDKELNFKLVKLYNKSMKYVLIFVYLLLISCSSTPNSKDLNHSINVHDQVMESNRRNQLNRMGSINGIPSYSPVIEPIQVVPIRSVTPAPNLGDYR